MAAATRAQRRTGVRRCSASLPHRTGRSLTACSGSAPVLGRRSVILYPSPRQPRAPQRTATLHAALTSAVAATRVRFCGRGRPRSGVGQPADPQRGSAHHWSADLMPASLPHRTGRSLTACSGSAPVLGRRSVILYPSPRQPRAPQRTATLHAALTSAVAATRVRFCGRGRPRSGVGQPAAVFVNRRITGRQTSWRHHCRTAPADRYLLAVGQAAGLIIGQAPIARGRGNGGRQTQGFLLGGHRFIGLTV